MTRACLLIVGLPPGKDHIVEAAVAAANKIGVRAVLLAESASEKNLGLDGTLVSDLSATQSDYAEHLYHQVARYLEQKTLTANAVFTAFDRYVPVASLLASRLQLSANPQRSVEAAVIKTEMRRLLASDPDLAVPFYVATSLAEAIQWVETHSSNWVMKPSRGAGSRGVFSGITTASDVRSAWDAIELRGKQELSGLCFDENDSLLIEAHLTGPEVDVELVLQNGQIKFSAVADNPLVEPPFRIETSSTYPSQLPESDQRAFVQHAMFALGRLGLHTGNFHVELIGTKKGPKIIEINPRMGGAFVWHAINSVYQIDLIELGVSALYQQAPDCSSAKAKEVIEASFFIPRETGTLEWVEGVEILDDLEFVRHVELWKDPGDSVLSPRDNPSDYMGFVLCAGQTHAEALRNTRTAMSLIGFEISPLVGQSNVRAPIS